MNNEKISRKMSFALRHKPEKFELNLDDEGFVETKEFCKQLNISIEQLNAIIISESKQRYELKNNKIRATYGHSLKNKIIKIPTQPPKILYHGTHSTSVNLIKQNSIKTMSRQYVHLSEDKETAKTIGERHGKPAVLEVKALDAWINGIKFYKEFGSIWLADEIPSTYIGEIFWI